MSYLCCSAYSASCSSCQQRNASRKVTNSILKRYLANAPRVSGPYASLTLRLPAIEVVCAGQEGFVHFVERIEALEKTPLEMAKLLGVADHPLLRAARHHQVNKREVLKILARILYSLDVESHRAKVATARRTQRAA